MRTNIYIGKHLSLHYTLQDRFWEFHLLPFIDICHDRILCGWLCFTANWNYNKTINEQILEDL